MRLTHLIAAAAAFLGLAVTAAQAQDWRLNPNYGSVTLRSGFTPDPYVVNLQSGGNLNVGQNISGCVGYITRQPDFRLFWQSGNYGLPLIISVASNYDTTLVVNGPNTEWYCNDDGGQGLNPSLSWSNPPSGQYDIWVGTYGQAALRPAQLHISELYSQ